MTDTKRNFDSDAATWDDNPGRVLLAEKVFTAIVNRIVLSTEMEVMDFGCGTGLLSIRLLPFVRSVVGVDSSAGMLDVFKRKILISGLGAISCQLINSEEAALAGSYNLITSSMTMHHLKDPSSLFRQFYTILQPGGKLCIADLDVDGGKFHPDPTGVFHEGFERTVMKQMMEEAGFAAITADTAHVMEKPDNNGVMQRFPVFCMIGTSGKVQE